MLESALQFLKLVILLIFLVGLLFDLFSFAFTRVSTRRRVAGALSLVGSPSLFIIPAHSHHYGFQAVVGFPYTARAGALHA
jgi:hypothetical protein